MTRGNARSALLVALLAALVLTPTAAQAQSAAQKAQATEHFEKGKRLYEVGKYGEAIEEYQKGYLAVDDPIFLYNIAQAYRMSDKPEEAVRFYRNYLRRSPDANNRATVERQITELEKQVEDRKRGSPTPPPVTPPPPSTGPVQPPIVTPTPPPPSVTPPPPSVTPGPETPTATVTDTAPPAESPGRGKRILGLTLLIGGGAMIAGSLVTGLIAVDKGKKVETQAANREFFNPDLEKQGKSLNVVTGVLFGVGALVGATGALFMYLGRNTETPTATAPPRLALYPLASPALAGAGARLTF